MIYWQCLLKAFENRNGKFLRFLLSSHLRSSVKNGTLKILQNSQENMLQAGNFIKKESSTQVFPYEFSESFKITFFSEQLRTTGSEFYK